MIGRPQWSPIEKTSSAWGTSLPGVPESTDEVARCVELLHFKGIKVHHSHSKILANDPKNDTYL